jgi:hypothetical protein
MALPSGCRPNAWKARSGSNQDGLAAKFEVELSTIQVQLMDVTAVVCFDRLPCHTPRTPMLQRDRGRLLPRPVGDTALARSIASQ